MNSNDIRLFDTNNVIEQVLDDAGRYWRPEFYQMNVAQVAAERRDRAINAVSEAIAWYAEKPLNKREVATLIVDNSEFALMGFDALDTTPQTAVGRWLARWW